MNKVKGEVLLSVYKYMLPLRSSSFGPVPPPYAIGFGKAGEALA
jgi:hypothetical protein